MMPVDDFTWHLLSLRIVRNTTRVNALGRVVEF